MRYRGAVLAWALAVVACGGGGGGGGDCSEGADSCGGDTICVDGRCEGAFGRVYEIRDIAVQVSTTNASGEAWDALGGAPDLFVQVIVDGSVVATTGVANDSFSASFGGPFRATLLAGSSLILQVVDEDVADHDSVFACQAIPVGADLLRSRSVQCSAGGTTVRFEIDPL